MRGKDGEAEILCYQALYDARSCRQTPICLCAELVLARIAILRGDVGAYPSAVQGIQNYAKENSDLHILRMVDLCLSVVSLVLNRTDHVAKWFCDMTSMKKALYAPTVPYAQILYSHLLLIEKKYEVLYAISQDIMDTARSFHYLLPQVYHLLFLSVAKHRSGDDRQAREYLRQALALAAPDRIFLPFAQNWEELSSLIESITSLSALPKAPAAPADAPENASAPHKEGGNPSPEENGIAALKELCRRQAKGVSAIKKALEKEKSPLTPREREIALLARDRFSAKEVAEKLHISEMTVKSTLRNVYNKLNIHSRAELNHRDF